VLPTGVIIINKWIVCVVFSHDISKTDAARITKLGIAMLHDETWKCIYLAVSKSKIKVTNHKNVARVGRDTLVSAGFV